MGSAVKSLLKHRGTKRRLGRKVGNNKGMGDMGGEDYMEDPQLDGIIWSFVFFTMEFGRTCGDWEREKNWREQVTIHSFDD